MLAGMLRICKLCLVKKCSQRGEELCMQRICRECKCCPSSLSNTVLPDMSARSKG